MAFRSPSRNWIIAALIAAVLLVLARLAGPRLMDGLRALHGM
ncbi:MAG: hypothetical protein ACOC8B_04015 [Gemmatimonadota bacterium]